LHSVPARRIDFGNAQRVTRREGCSRDALVAFSGKLRGSCPSCGTRRMPQTAAYLVDAIIPRVAVRQCGLSVPLQLWRLLAVHQ
jgi:hypothetical protein